jgi:hypothetical protein
MLLSASDGHGAMEIRGSWHQGQPAEMLFVPFYTFFPLSRAKLRWRVSSHQFANHLSGWPANKAEKHTPWLLLLLGDQAPSHPTGGSDLESPGSGVESPNSPFSIPNSPKRSWFGNALFEPSRLTVCMPCHRERISRSGVPHAAKCGRRSLVYFVYKTKMEMPPTLYRVRYFSTFLYGNGNIATV